jgi:hypothetical protein
MADQRSSPSPFRLASVGVVAVALVFVVVLATWATQIKITEVAGFPNERTSNDPPANAIDGDNRARSPY